MITGKKKKYVPEIPGEMKQKQGGNNGNIIKKK